MDINTKLAQIGNKIDPNGAISFPVYHSATFAHPALGESTGFDYSRSNNPTRQVLEDAIAQIEGGFKGFAFSSGMAAISTLLTLFKPQDHLLVTEDLYGGTYRLIQNVFTNYGIEVSFVDTSDLEKVEQAIKPNSRAIICETPTNPILRIADLKSLAELAKANNLLCIIDNTFMTPFLQRPIELGADIIIHSGSKYLGGHNDLIAGLVVVKDQALADKVYYLQNAMGAILGPQDSWLLIRGLKTLGLRMATQEKNAREIAQWLAEHPLIEKVYYPGLLGHPGHQIQKEQASGFGAIVSFQLKYLELVPEILKRVKIISFAESLGGVESLITYPWTQTHTDIPIETRERTGVNDRLLRMSVGIEAAQDIMNDLSQAISVKNLDTK
ncbi:MAG: PLP-dependent aspartate aminotransferase family protein [Desulfitobacteriaceae bacterium]